MIIGVEYKGVLEDGKEFDSNIGEAPLVFTFGAGEVLPAFEEQIKGLAQGASKKFTIKAKDAYGDADPAKIVTVKRDKKTFPDSLVLVPGQYITATQQDPQGNPVQFPVKVVDASDKEVTLDYNHPLAGQNLKYEVKIVSISPGQQPKEEASVEDETQKTSEQKTENPEAKKAHSKA